MLPNTTSPAMPMGSAVKLPLNTAELMPPISAPGIGAPPPQAAGQIAGPSGTPLGGSLPPPEAPKEPPYTVEMQPDGSAVWKSKTNPPVVIGVVPAPKIPASLQPPKV